ncbi:MAG: type II toxin-antitoxin system VapC family toxin [Azonexus sp.]|nr:type II toxin-antitoxin system VapC family toxin [Betaproteobacteria bacterium]MBK8919196.1 type II toxin-antitoxin system VapC family toxin [Betaproteobacteria bacterium]MBP6037460.1 type II toxin-antitoxin system VapC family toxin [Azonexus sp.]MBP6908069.1 type II toxin-antitoxin system VapC family toxin [Azonexus sp.]
MILIDTNVISELWKVEPYPAVLAWIDAQAVETLYLSAITVAELRFGVATMPEGKRRSIYQDRLEREVLPAFTGRVLPFDLEASQAYAELMARAKSEGKAIGKADGYIAATAAARALTVATRDVAPFQATGLAVINPWMM